MELNYELSPEGADFSDYKTVDRFSEAQHYVSANNMGSYDIGKKRIQAFRWDGTMENARDMIPESEGDEFNFIKESKPLLYLINNPLSNPCKRGDYVIRVGKGKYYTCTADFFTALIGSHRLGVI